MQASLAGLPAASKLDGVDLSAVVHGAKPSKKGAYSQYPRCPPGGKLSVVQNGACFNNPGTSFGYFGYAVRYVIS